jgi:hypothetical protein
MKGRVYKGPACNPFGAGYEVGRFKKYYRSLHRDHSLMEAFSPPIILPNSFYYQILQQRRF